jgi:hypothetical protein
MEIYIRHISPQGVTIMKNKMILTGIFSLTLIFATALIGCPGTTDDTPPPAATQSLTGIWVDNRTTPTKAYIFTDVTDAAVAGAKVAYYSTNLTAGNQAATGTEVTIGNSAYTFTLASNTLTLIGYGIAQGGGSRPDVVFDRAQGSSGTTIHGVWVSRLPSTDQQYTLLIIRTGTANVFTSVGSNNWGVTAYTLTANANTTYITWGGNNPIAYTKETNPDTLDISAPGGNAPDAGLITLSGF